MTRIISGLLLLAAAAAGPLAAAAESLPKVAVVYSYLPGEWQKGLGDGVRAAFRDFGKNVSVTDYVYDSDLWGTKTPAEIAAERGRLYRLIAGENYPYVVVCDDEAADLLIPVLVKDRARKVFFTGVNRAEKELPWLKNRPENLSGVFERFQVAESLEMLSMFDPRVSTISLITSDTKSSRVIARDIEEGVRRADGKIKLRRSYVLGTWAEWEKAVAEIAGLDQALWLLVPYGVAGPDGKEMPVEAIGDYLRAHLRIPTLGIISVHTKIGVLVAISVSPYDLGAAVGEQVVRAMNGEAQKSIGVYPLRKSRLEINLQESERLGLPIPEKLRSISTIVNLRELPLKR